VWGIIHQLVRNQFESPSLLDSEHLTSHVIIVMFMENKDGYGDDVGNAKPNMVTIDVNN
jgi:hypothetical protein